MNREKSLREIYWMYRYFNSEWIDLRSERNMYNRLHQIFDCIQFTDCYYLLLDRLLTRRRQRRRRCKKRRLSFVSCRIDDWHFSHFMLDVPNATLNFFANWKKIKFRCQSNSASWSLRDLRGQHDWFSKEEGHGRRQKFIQGSISYKSNEIFGILNFNWLAVETVFFWHFKHLV